MPLAPARPFLHGRTLHVLLLAALGACGFAPASRAHPAPAPPTVTVRSPDGRVRVEFGVDRAGPSYRVLFRGAEVVGASAMGLDLAGTGSFGADVRVARVTRRAHDETVRGVIGKTSAARDHFREAVVALEERGGARRRVEVVFRAYDDGVAFRYRIPAQAALDSFTITQERTRFALDARSRAYALPLFGFTSSYEGYYTAGPLGALPADTLLAVPLLTQHPGGAWVAVTEAALDDYAGMYLVRPRAPAGAPLESRLSPLPERPAEAVRARAPHASPWRVLMLADDPGRLVESNLVYLLAEPSRVPDALSWVRPGKTTFPWWNDYALPDSSFESGLNTATMKHYVDFCAEAGIAYHTLDGYKDRAWYGGPIIPDSTAQDLTRATPAIDMPELLRYAREKSVRIRLWMHWRPLRDQIDRAFAQYEAWGIEGVMVDFMDRDDQEMVAFYREIAEKAARHHLTVVLHGAYKPDGMGRTFPNVLTREGVFNLEHNKWGRGSTAEHELTVPFTRMLAGPLDYHQGGFRYADAAGFEPRFTAPLVVGTRARTLATYVVYENPLPMLADYPGAYRGEPGLAFLAATPTVWDETRVLHAAVGDAVTIVRRSGTAWYAGSMNDGEPRALEVPLRFLGTGTFVAEVFADDVADVTPAGRARPVHASYLVTAADTLRVRMAPAGGHAVRFTPAPPRSALPRYRR